MSQRGRSLLRKMQVVPLVLLGLLVFPGVAPAATASPDPAPAATWSPDPYTPATPPARPAAPILRQTISPRPIVIVRAPLAGGGMPFDDILASTVAALVRSGRGILAADESGPTITKRFNALGIE